MEQDNEIQIVPVSEFPTQKDVVHEQHPPHPYKVVVEAHSGDRWLAYCPPLEPYGAAAWGYTREEAVTKTREAAQMIVEQLMKSGILLPDRPQDEGEVFSDLPLAIAG